ncbi:hypothetical protein P7K49_031569, partial [Saguinus oedipus]
IPEDPLVAEEYYADTFDSYCEESDEEEEGTVLSGPEKEIKKKESQPAYRTNQQVYDIPTRNRGTVQVVLKFSLHSEALGTLSQGQRTGYETGRPESLLRTLGSDCPDGSAGLCLLGIVQQMENMVSGLAAQYESMHASILTHLEQFSPAGNIKTLL